MSARRRRALPSGASPRRLCGARCLGVLLGTALVASTGPLLTAAPAAAATAPAGVGLTGLDPVAARAVAPVATVPNPAPAAPAPEGPPAPPRSASPVTRAVEKARTAGTATVVDELTTTRAVTTAGPDGQLTTEVSTRPVRFKDAAGSWRDLDLTLAAAGGVLRPRAASPAAPGLPALSGPGSLVTIGTGPSAFSWGPVDALKVAPTVGGGGQAGAPAAARLAAALPGGRDVQLQLGADTVSESVVLRDRLTATAYPGYTDAFTVPAGATARQTPSGVEFVDAAGTVLSSFGGGHAFDSLSTPDSGEAATTPVSTRLVQQVGRTVTVSVGVDAVWLAAPARVFPVTIDPEFNAAAATQYDTYLDAANPTTAEGGYDPGVLKAGWRAPTSGAGLAETRSLVFFPLPDELSNAARQQNNVLSAQLSVFNNHSSTCGATPAVQVRPNAQGWSAAGATWNNQPGTVNTVTSGTFAYGYSSSCPANWARLDVQPQAQGWSAGSFTNYGLQLATATSEATGYKRFAPADAGGATAPSLRIVWENCTTIAGGPNGPHKVCGAIRDKYRQLGGTSWGYPTNDESPTADGQGAFNHFAAPGQTAESASIFWHPTTGPHVVRFAIRTRWLAVGADRPGGLGYPETDEQSEVLGGASAQFYVPANGTRNTITWASAYGAWEIRGAIRDRWLALGDISGVGFARIGDTVVTGGAYNIFGYPDQLDQSIAWTPSTGAHRTRGAIRQSWLAEGDRTGWLGYPLDDEQPIAGGVRSEFQGGNITYDSRTNSTVVGAGVVQYPTPFQKVTQKRTQLQAAAKVTSHDYDNVTFQWRPYSVTPGSAWNDVPSSDLQNADGTPVPGSNPLPVTSTTVPPATGTPGVSASTPGYTAKTSARYTWNATSTIGADGLVQVRAVFHDTTDNTGRPTGVSQITVDRAGLTGAASTATVGPGTVSLLTGAYALTGRDADITAPMGGLALTRTFQSNDPLRPGPLGPGWVPSLAVDEAGADYAGLVDRDSTALISREDGSQLPFVRSAPGSSTYVAEGEAGTEGSTLVFTPGTSGTPSTPASYVLTDEDGDSVTFTRADAAAGHGTDSPAGGAAFRVTKVSAVRGTGSPAVTTVLYTAAGTPRALIAPTDDGTSCPDTASATTTGCRWLEFTYTDATASQKMTGVVLHARGAAATAGGLVDAATPITASTVTLATYAYDSSGRLSSVTDPRSAMTATYTYDSSGRLAGITPPGGQSTWTPAYTATSSSALAPVRLTTATLSATGSSTLAPLTSTVVYDVPLPAGNGRPDLTPDAVKAWGQTSSPPTDLTALFSPANDPHTAAVSAITDPTVWQGAQLSALDVNGRTVNTAYYGGTVDKAGNTVPAAWRIDTTEYDSQNRGNTIRTLSAGNRERALASSTDAAAQLRQARVLDTFTTYSPDGRDVLREYGPAHPVTVRPAGGTARTSDVRSRTATNYDTGTEPGHPAGPTLHLPLATTTDTIDVVATVPAPTAADPAAKIQVSTSSDYLAGPAGDKVPTTSGVTARTTKLAYSDGSSTDNGYGWAFGSAVKTTVNPTGASGDPATDQVAMSRVDSQGRTVSSTLPAGNGAENTAATTLTTYYAATTPVGGDPACTQPAYAGWVCKTRPAAQPATTSTAGTPFTFGVPTTLVAAYDLYGDALRTVETAPDGTVTRTSDTRYDAAGRTRVSTTGTTGTTGSEAVQAVPETDTDYEPGTGRLLTVSTPGGSAAAGTAPLTYNYDVYGRRTSYTDGTGTTTSTKYDAAGRVSGTHSDHGDRTITYDQNGDRGLPVSLSDSAASPGDPFVADYDSDGNLSRQTYPGGLVATALRDASDALSTLAYSKPTSATSGDWVRSSSTYGPFDQTDTRTDTTAAGTTGDPATTNTYTYDATGRLTNATDTPTGSTDPSARCARAYGYDRNSNRTSRTTTCGPTTSTDSYTYDGADRLLPNTTSRATLRYDHLGRTRTLPSVDTVDGGGDLTLGFYANDLVASQTQTTGGTTRTTNYTLDPSLRRTLRTDTLTGQPTDTTISHYDDDTDNPDWTSNPNGSWTRNISGFGDTLTATQTLTGAGATTNTSSLTLQLANLHGDILATLPATATNPSQVQVSETDEYGLAKNKPAAGMLQPRYGYLGAEQRDSSTAGGLILMGSRVYTPMLGRFLSTDPVPGGSANDYDYAAADPVNNEDLNGETLQAAMPGGGGGMGINVGPGGLSGGGAGIAAGAAAAGIVGAGIATQAYKDRNSGGGRGAEGSNEPQTHDSGHWRGKGPHRGQMDPGEGREPKTTNQNPKQHQGQKKHRGSNPKKKKKGGKEHTRNASPSKKERHQQGRGRNRKDRPGGEKGDKRRRY